MSLLYWFPLNGDLHNQGLRNITLINQNSVSINTNGKIGSCYEFNGSNRLYAAAALETISSTSITLAFWAKIDSSATSNSYIGGLSKASSANFMAHYNCSTKVLNFYINGALQLSFQITNYVDSWHHYILCSDSTSIYIYIDGELKAEKVYTVSISTTSYLNIGARRNNSTSGTGYFKGLINDFRIYDHCLSLKEINELVKGLILHYKMTDLSMTELNIIDCSGYNNFADITGTLSLSNDAKKYQKSIYASDWSSNFIITHGTIGNPSDAITINIWYKINRTTHNQNYYELFNHRNNSQYFEIAIHKTGYFRGGMVINGSRKIDNTSVLNLLDCNWHMLSMTYDGNNLIKYVDGVQQTSISATGVLTGANGQFVIGGKYTNNYSCVDLFISDVRIYATALNAAAIKELYDTSASIDSFGNIYAREFVSQDNVSFQLSKAGIIISPYFLESNNNQASINNNETGDNQKEIIGYQFYEY